MKLHYFWSINPLKVRFLLEELGLAHQLVEVDLFKGQHRDPAFAVLHPAQKVPVLEEDDGFKVWESNAILVYVGEREGQLWPRGLRQRTDGLRWLFFEACHLVQAVGPLWFNEFVAPKASRPTDATAIERARTDLARWFPVLEQQLARGTWMLGEDFSLVDCCYGTDLAALSATSFDWKPYPSARAYLERVRARPAWKACAPRY
jgi:glutathione S-transferase